MMKLTSLIPDSMDGAEVNGMKSNCSCLSTGGQVDSPALSHVMEESQSQSALLSEGEEFLLAVEWPQSVV